MSNDAREAVVRRYYELVDRGDVEGLIALFARDSVYLRPGYQPLRGHDELRRFYTEDRMIREGRHELDAVIVNETSAAARGAFRGTLRDDRRVEVRFADFFVFAGDRFAYRETFFFAPMV